MWLYAICNDDTREHLKGKKGDGTSVPFCSNGATPEWWRVYALTRKITVQIAALLWNNYT